MRIFVQYKPSGEIFSLATTSSKQVPIAIRDFKILEIFERILPGEYKVENNSLVKYSLEGASRYKQVPLTPAEWDPKLEQWIDTRTLETQWEVVTTKRNELLAATDWVAARAYEQNTPVPENYRIYRQALRDITNQTDPFDITWPVLEE